MIKVDPRHHMEGFMDQRKPQVSAVSTGARLRAMIGLGLASSLLLWASYYPLNWGWLGWVALIPLLGLVRAQSRSRNVYLAALISGLAFFLPVISWMREADERMIYAWPLLAFYCALYVPAAIFLLRRLGSVGFLPFVVAVPVVFTALEFLRAHLITGFPWYFLGHTQQAFLPMIQIADLGGAYAVSFVVGLVNAFLFEVLWEWGPFRRLCDPAGTIPLATSRLLAKGAVVACVLAAMVGYGFVRIGQEAFSPGPKLLLIQSNLPQRIREDPGEAKKIIEEFGRLMRAGFANGVRPDLIVWPESSLYHSWFDMHPAVKKEQLGEEQQAWPGAVKRCRDEIAEIAKQWQIDWLLGVTTSYMNENAKVIQYNSGLLVRPDGKLEVRYNKIHPIPFGEYLPFRDWLPFMKWFAAYDFDYSVTPGDTQNRFALGPYHFGVLICYEDTDPVLARRLARAGKDGPAADFIVNISNDGWFNGTAEHEQHLANCRFRAIEARRPIARAVNMGVSGVIDGSGRYHDLPGSSPSASKQISAAISTTIPLDNRTSLYPILGDWLPWLCWLVIGVGWISARSRARPLTQS